MVDKLLFEQLSEDVLPVFRSMSKNDKFAIALGGSDGKGLSDQYSDFDFRVYYEQAANNPQWSAAFTDLNWYIEKWKALDLEIDGVWACSIAEVDHQLDEWLTGKATPVPMFWNIWGYNIPTDIYNQVILEDPCGIVQSWKDRLCQYPDDMRNSIISRHAFSLRYWRNDYHYRNKVMRQDHMFCASITSRLMNDVMQVLYALNRFYFPGDGMNLIFARQFSNKLEGMENRVTEILYPGGEPNGMERQYQGMLRLIDDVLALPGMEKY